MGKTYGGIFDFEGKSERLEEVNLELENPELWNNPEQATAISKEKSLLDGVINIITSLDETLEDATAMLELAVEADDIDLLKGVVITCAVTIVMYYIQGILSFESQTNAMFDGFKTMLYPLSTVVASFFLKEVNDALGMTQYVINAVTPYLDQATYPAIVFVVLALIVFGTSSSWGVFIIAIPIVIPIAQSLNVHMPLVIGALLSASSFGSHSCFFSDSSVLASQGAGCAPMQHAFTQFPYALLGAVLALVAFVVLGYSYAG